jgi:hypothetical protein
MRTWIRQKLLNLLLDSDSRPGSLGRISVSLADCDVMASDPSIDLPDPIRFRVQQVSGGTVIETKYYDHKKDEERIKLHIVTPEENLSESIGKIVTMELLQK